MKPEYRYILDPSSRKFKCPGCKQFRFVRYIDLNTAEYMSESFGRCDREVNCGYHFNPYKVKQEGGSNWSRKISNEIQPINALQSYIPPEVLIETLKPEGYLSNRFIQNLLTNVPYVFNKTDIETIISQYYLGTVQQGSRAGFATFPFIDINGNINTIQAKQFNKENHTIATDFVHSIIDREYSQKEAMIPEWLSLYKQNDLKVSCLFGEHLLSKYPMNPVALVEAPKTAVYCTLYFGFPDSFKKYIWLAVYNLSSLTYQKCKVLRGRDVYLFPDLSVQGKAFNLWSSRAKEMEHDLQGTRFIVSDLLESFASITMREKGADLADILIKMNWRDFKIEKNHLSLELSESLSTDDSKNYSENSEKSECSDTNNFLCKSENSLIEHEEFITGNQLVKTDGVSENILNDEATDATDFEEDDACGYIREPYKGLDYLYTCPHCFSPKMFVRYIDLATGKYFGEKIGRCNREILCGYDLKPGLN